MMNSVRNWINAAEPLTFFGFTADDLRQLDVAATLTQTIDKTISIFSPKRALHRQYHRELLTRSSMPLYAAAKTNRLTGPWTVSSPNVNELIRASSPVIRARVRQLVRDFPYFARAVANIVDYTVGEGIKFQAKVKDAEGKLDKKINTRIEDVFKRWSDEADVSGKLNFYEIMRLAKRQDVESGEFVILHVLKKNRNRYLPYSMQMYEPDWLFEGRDAYGSGGIGLSAAPGEKETRQGIQYNKLTGEVTGYWFKDPNYGGLEAFIPADQISHGFDMLRPQQLRGVTPLATGVLVAHDLSDYMDAEMDAAKLAAKYLAFVKTPFSAERQAQLAMGGTLPGDETKKIETMENAIIEYLRPGEDISLSKNDRPGATFTPFVHLILTMLSISSGVPYELLSGDYSGLNFSTARIVRNDFTQQLRPISKRHIRQYCLPVYRRVVDIAVLTGQLDLPGYYKEPWRYWESEWTPPGMEAVDPLREAKSQIDSVAYCLKSPQEIVRERGRDLEEVYNEIAAAKEMAKDLGLDFTIIPTGADKNNPAAVQNQPLTTAALAEEFSLRETGGKETRIKDQPSIYITNPPINIATPPVNVAAPQVHVDVHIDKGGGTIKKTINYKDIQGKDKKAEVTEEVS